MVAGVPVVCLRPSLKGPSPEAVSKALPVSPVLGSPCCSVVTLPEPSHPESPSENPPFESKLTTLSGTKDDAVGETVLSVVDDVEDCEEVDVE